MASRHMIRGMRQRCGRTLLPRFSSSNSSVDLQRRRAGGIAGTRNKFSGTSVFTCSVQIASPGALNLQCSPCFSRSPTLPFRAHAAPATETVTTNDDASFCGLRTLENVAGLACESNLHGIDWKIPSAESRFRIAARVRTALIKFADARVRGNELALEVLAGLQRADLRLDAAAPAHRIAPAEGRHPPASRAHLVPTDLEVFGLRAREVRDAARRAVRFSHVGRAETVRHEVTHRFVSFARLVEEPLGCAQTCRNADPIRHPAWTITNADERSSALGWTLHFERDHARGIAQHPQLAHFTTVRRQTDVGARKDARGVVEAATVLERDAPDFGFARARAAGNGRECDDERRCELFSGPPHAGRVAPRLAQRSAESRSPACYARGA